MDTTPQTRAHRMVMSLITDGAPQGDIAISSLLMFTPYLSNQEIADYAVLAKKNYNHVIYRCLIVVLCRNNAKHLISHALKETIDCPEDMIRIADAYWSMTGRKSLPSQMKKSFRRVMPTFHQKELTRCSEADRITLRRIICMVRPKPTDEDQSSSWKQLFG